MARLVLICGHSGAGKTTLSRALVRRLNAVTQESHFLLDKDTAYSRYSANVMRILTGDPDDRDSDVFLRELREPEYAGMLAIARENIEVGVNVVLCAPFSREVRSRCFEPAASDYPDLLILDNSDWNEARAEQIADLIVSAAAAPAP